MKRFQLVLGVILFLSLVLSLIIFFTGDADLKESAKLEFLKILLQLLLLTALGTIVKIILENYNEAKKKAEIELERNKEKEIERSQYFNSLRKDLINSIQNVRRSRSIIIANKSAKTYGEQMKEIMDAKFEVSDLKEEIANSEYSIKNSLKLESKKALNGIEKYISNLIIEYRENYKDLSETQINAPNEVWSKLYDLQYLKGFLQTNEKGTYQKEFLADYFIAKRLIGRIGKEEIKTNR